MQESDDHHSGRWKRFCGPLLVSLLLAAYAGLAISSVRHKSATFDEVAHLAGGYSFWQFNDYRLYPENGIFPQRWATIPLLFGRYEFPSRDQPDWRQSRAYSLGFEFLYHTGNDAAAMLFRTRAMMVVLGVALGGLVYAWSRQLFGPGGGLISLALYAFCPNMLAHGRLATSEIAVSLTFVAALWSVWIALHHVSAGRVLLAGLALGLLAVSKYSAVLIAPVAVLLLVVRLAAGRPLVLRGLGRRLIVRQRPKQLAICASVFFVELILSCGVIWAFYGFRFSQFEDAAPGRDQMEFGATVETLSAGVPLGHCITAMDNARLLPRAYLHGLAFVLQFERTPSIAFLNGQYSSEGFAAFFPYCFLVKTTHGLWALLALAVAAACWPGRGDSKTEQPRRFAVAMRGLYRTAPLWILLIVFAIVAVRHRVNIGHRHILPIYPLLFILAGAAVRWFQQKRKLMSALVLLSVFSVAVESVWIWPHYLAYFNQIDGGPSRAYRHVVDSTLDWGQDLAGLKRWLDAETASRGRQQIYIAYFGNGNPQYEGLDSLLLQVGRGRGEINWNEYKELTGGVYCISATVLQTVYTPAQGRWHIRYEQAYQQLLHEIETWTANDKEAANSNSRGGKPPAELIEQFQHLRLSRLCVFLRHREPDDHIGYSILIYRLTDEDVRQATHGPPVELAND